MLIEVISVNILFSSVGLPDFGEVWSLFQGVLDVLDVQLPWCQLLNHHEKDARCEDTDEHINLNPGKESHEHVRILVIDILQVQYEVLQAVDEKI
jgi:hypothetical protein